MFDSTVRDGVVAATPPLALTWRQVLFFACVGLTIAGMIRLAMVALSPGGIGIVDLLLIVLFAVTLPWYVIGFWKTAFELSAPFWRLLMATAARGLSGGS